MARMGLCVAVGEGDQIQSFNRGNRTIKGHFHCIVTD